MVSVIDFNYSPCALVLKNDPTSRIEFQSFPVEEGITEGYNADYVKTSGRAAEPFGRLWQGGDWNPININLQFRAGMDLASFGPRGVIIGRMLNKVNWIKAAPFPRPRLRPQRAAKYKLGEAKKFARTAMSSYGGQTADPPFVLFVWGLFMTLQGKVTAWTVTWMGPYEPISGKPHGANVQLTFQPESGFYPNWYDIKDGYTPDSLVARLL